MARINKRFYKVLRLSFVVIIITIIFIACSKYISDDSVSVSDYKKYLQSYLDSNSNIGFIDSISSSNTDSNSNNIDDISSSPSNNENKKTKNKNEISTDNLLADTLSTIANVEKITKAQKFFDQIFQNIIDFSPSGQCSRKYKEGCKIKEGVNSRPEHYDLFPTLSHQSLINCLDLSANEIKNLSETHKKYVDSLGVTLPNDIYKGNGIVTVGGGRFSLMAFLIIKNLRDLGSKLPVEVFIPPGENRELEFCNNLLPQYNAKCIYIDRILSPKMTQKFKFKGYQFKSLAMVASSFENLLLLDADNFPVKNLDLIFNKEPFKSNGLILWPDYWRRSTTPYFYEIAGIPIDLNTRVRNSYDDLTPPEVYTKDINDLKDVPLHDLKGTMPDSSTESGQLLINKKKHLGTMLLSLYYNVNGPTWYYPIFTQKAAGEGDKETFIAAATFYDLPYYQVKSNTDVDGYFDELGFHGVAMLQYDFIQDFKLYELAKHDISIKYGLIGNSNKKQKQNKINYDPNYTLADFEKYFKTKENHDIMFIHSNFPKFDPVQLSKEKKLMNEKDQHFRGYNGLSKFGQYDIELSNFKIFNEFFCSKKKVPYFPYVFEALKDSPTGWEDMCKYITDRLKFLIDTHEEAISDAKA